MSAPIAEIAAPAEIKNPKYFPPIISPASANGAGEFIRFSADIIPNQPVLVGSFGSPRGLKGDISINIFMSNLKSFKMLKEFFLEENKKPK